MPSRAGIGLLQAQLQLLLDKLPDSQPDKMEFIRKALQDESQGVMPWSCKNAMLESVAIWHAPLHELSLARAAPMALEANGQRIALLSSLSRGLQWGVGSVLALPLLWSLLGGLQSGVDRVLPLRTTLLRCFFTRESEHLSTATFRRGPLLEDLRLGGCWRVGFPVCCFPPCGVSPRGVRGLCPPAVF